MSIRTAVFAVALASVASLAVAQTAPAPAIVGASPTVNGLVTVSFGSNVASVTADSPIINGARYVTSATGNMTLNFADGCQMTLGPNSMFQVNTALPCDQRIASVQNIAPQVATSSNFLQTMSSVLPANAVQLASVTALAGAVGAVAQNANRAPISQP